MVICETRLFCSVLAALGGSCHMTFHLGKQSIPTLRGVMRRKPSAESGKKMGHGRRYIMLCTKSAESKMDVS